MARVFPKKLPPDAASAAERGLYNVLTRQLDDSWVVIYSLPWMEASGRVLSEGECDFIVLHPSYGLLVIEAKTGTITHDRETGRWRCDNGTTIQDPVRQAQRCAHRVANELAKRLSAWRNGARLPFGHAIALPHTRKLPKSMPLHAPPEMFILEGDMPRLEKRLIEILARFDRRDTRACQLPLDDGEFQAVVDALLPRFRIVSSLAHRLEGEQRAMLRLTAQQNFFLQACRHIPRLYVGGPAGSGKTLLAVEEARRFAADGADVLLLCYNKALARHLRDLLTGVGVKAVNFHDLCQEVAEATGLWPGVPCEPAARRRFFDEDSAELLLSVLPAWAPRYDAILADEAQDFAETWWVPIVELLKDPDDGFLHLFGDPGQDIYGRAAARPFSDLPTLPLALNCRNTQAIARWIKDVTGFDAPTLDWCPEGEIPTVTEVAGDHEEREAIRRTLHRLLNEERLGPGRGVLLGARAFDKSGFAGHPAIGPWRIANLRDESEPARGEGGRPTVNYSTIHAFKGLEADIVLLTGVGLPPAHGEDPLTLLYVAASRARHRLYVYRRFGGFT
ncbi:MAG: NERD domain-containing protein [Planctomycetes bacterium]|nr:NERD domain-containing protein [Planctomycetota bacterium]